MDANQIGGIVRAVVAGLGGYFVGRGWVDQATVEQLGGAVAVIVVAVWSVISKKKKVAT